MFTYIVINCLLTLPALLACHCLTLFASFLLYIFGTLCAIFTYACFVFGMQHVAMSNNTLDNDAASAAVSVSAFSASSAVDVECRRRCVALHARHREHIVLHFESNMSRITSPAPTTPPTYKIYQYQYQCREIATSRTNYYSKLKEQIERFYSSTV